MRWPIELGACLIMVLWMGPVTHALAENGTAPDSDTPSVWLDGESIHYVGKTNAAGLRALEGILSTASVVPTTFVVNSSGGPGLAAIQIARLVHARAMHVVVTGRGCTSSCANYIFVPGARKTINPGSIVVWHNSCPRNVRPDTDFQQTFERERGAVTMKVDGETVDDPQRVSEWIANNQTVLQQNLVEITSEHEAFFAGRGIDDRVSCLVDYIKVPFKAYTLSIRDMSLFGVCNVTAEPDYAARALKSVRESGRGRSEFGVVDMRRIRGFLPADGVNQCNTTR